MNADAGGSPRLEAARSLTDQVEVVWDDGRRECFHNLWLRDNCPTGRGYVNGIEHRTHRLVELPERPAAVAVSCTPDELCIEWAEGHRSVFDARWLDVYSPTRATPMHRPPPTTWDATDLAEVPSWTLAELDDPSLFALLDALLGLGMVRVRATPPEPGFMRHFCADLTAICDTIFGPTWALRPPAEADALTRQMEHSLFPLHTDLTFFQSTGTHQAFHCIALDEEGGESIFADGFRIAEDLRRDSPEHFAILSTYDTPYRYLDDTLDSRARRRIITVDHRGALEAIAFCDRQMLPLDLPSDRIMPYYRAYRDWARRANEPRYALEFKLEAGDLVLFDNRRILHGRRAISTTHGAVRHIEGCYLQPDGLEARWRRLLRERTHGQTPRRDPWPSIRSPSTRPAARPAEASLAKEGTKPSQARSSTGAE